MMKNENDQVTPIWEADILGDGFTQTVIDLGNDPDDETDIAVTVVKFSPSPLTSSDTPEPEYASRPAVLWVHGMSDYFFQDHVARRFHDKGYAFYAVDLRKCGRSLRPGQRAHHITNLELYDVDMNAAIDVIREAGHPSVTPLGHSTGGLIVALWLYRLRSADPDRFGFINVAVLNSPWLGLQFKNPVGIAVKALTRLMAVIRPDQLTPDKGMSGYGQSISASHHGDWVFDAVLKPVEGHVKTWSWFQAILAAQAIVAKGIEMGVPTLVLHSDASILGKPYSPALDTVDAILDAEQIASKTRCLGKGASNFEIPGARHDVFLSREHAREQAFAVTFDFLESHLTTASSS
ncbi:alpha/beta hydrolase [Corynebacterium sp. H78]|uniref:alpha/beta hydrolase n=1 Tax=Corynebacterium sp. H78 TaxID=3133417 RepID=UPI0030991089